MANFSSCSMSMCPTVAGVLIRPGDTAFTRTPSGPRSAASALVMSSTAALLTFGLREALVAAGVAPPARLLAVLAAAPLAYLTLVLVAAPSLVREIKGLRRARTPEATAPSAVEGAI